MSDLPLFDRFPGLRSVPRAELCSLPSPVEQLSEKLWIKRDDRNAPFCGGNKVRSLEFLLGDIQPGDTVITLGGVGSTHVLSTAIHAARLGANTVAYRWRHDMNDVAELVAARVSEEVSVGTIDSNAFFAICRARIADINSTAQFIPVGGSVPLGVLGHVNAALELNRQIENGEMPKPDRIILPLGSGGTLAGLALGFASVNRDIDLIGVRVGPRIFVRKGKVVRLARATARLIARYSPGNRIDIDQRRIHVEHQYYGGAYGRPLAIAADAAATLLRQRGIRLDDTYSAKAFAAATDAAGKLGGITLFWLTFDARCLTK